MSRAGKLAQADSVAQVLLQRCHEAPAKEAFRFLGRDGATESVLRYEDLDRRARLVASRIARTHTNPRVCILCPAGLNFVTALFGCFYGNGIAIPANPPRRRSDDSLVRLNGVCEDCQPEVVLTTSEIHSELSDARHAVPSLRNAQWIVVDDFEEVEGSIAFAMPTAHGGSGIALIQYTSGSVGKPRGVVITHENLLANSQCIYEGFRHSTSSQGVIWLPPHHDMGLVGGIIQPVFGGFPCALLAPSTFLLRPFIWLRAISEYRGTTSGGPNFAFDYCVRRVSNDERAALDLSSWDVAFCGAEPVKATTINAFSKTFGASGFRRQAFFPCYGLAEATLAVSLGRKDELPVVRRFVTRDLRNGRATEGSGAETTELVGCGSVVPGHAVEVLREHADTNCATGEVGEICVTGPSVSVGYWDALPASPSLVNAGNAQTTSRRLRTSDLGFIHDGQLFVTGRKDDVMVVRGFKYYPQDIEDVVLKVDGQRLHGRAAAFAEPGGASPEVTIVYEIHQRHEKDYELVQRTIRQLVGSATGLQVHRVVLTKRGKIPTTPSGKLQRRLCRSLLACGSLPILSEWRAREGWTNHDGHAFVPP